MNKLSYLIYCAKRADYGKVIRIARDISEESGRPVAAIMSDMFYCAARYRTAFNHYREFDYHLLDPEQRKTYLTVGTANDIVKKYNDPAYFHILDDKITFNERYCDFVKRDWIDIARSDIGDFADFVSRHDRIIAKPSGGIGGHGIELIETGPDTDIPALHARLRSNGIDLIEEVIVQHPDVSKLYSGSVNSMRMFTFYDGSQGHHLQTVFKLGSNGSAVDNFSSGGMYTFLDNEGVIRFPAIDGDDNVFEEHPVTGMHLAGYRIPLISEAIDTVVRASAVTPEVAYIGWDVAISEKGPVIIEGNAYPGIYEPKGRFLHDHEPGILSVYRKYMDI